MENSETILKISVIWRGNKYVLDMDCHASLKELGHELQNLTDVKEDTMRLIVPQNKGSNLFSPFSDDHSSLSLKQVYVSEGKPIRMMGSSEVEIDKVLQSKKADLRILGFDEEEKRLRQRMLDKPSAMLKLPQGQYIFCDFRTLQIPGIELNPPSSEALKRMHMLAADPGIIAIMNKHCWRVGIMTEMAPVGYVGVSPKCILGFNENHGEEISLRLRTDDLKGFRKYERIKKTLLHELAHMVYSEHDANFYALEKQLTQEAATLDWTRSKGHTLSGISYSDHYGDDFSIEDTTKSSQKLGGDVSDKLADARASSVAAAYRRLANASIESSKANEEPDPDDSGHRGYASIEPSKANEEPDPDDSGHRGSVDEENTNAQSPRKNGFEPYPDDSEREQKLVVGHENNLNSHKEPDPDDSMDMEKSVLKSLENKNITTPENGHALVDLVTGHEGDSKKSYREPDPDDSRMNRYVNEEPDPDDGLAKPQSMEFDEPDLDDQELKRIQDSVSIASSRLQKAIEMLKAEVGPSEAAVVLQTLFKIIRNVIEHPDEMKYKRLRKANPVIQRNVANYKAGEAV